MIELLLPMSLTGSAVFLAWWVLCRAAGDRLSARWRYAALKGALLFLLVPVGSCLAALGDALRPASPVLPSSPDLWLPALPETGLPLAGAATAPLSVPFQAGQILALVWGLGAAALLISKTAGFLRFRRQLRTAGLSDPPAHVRVLLPACQQQLRVLTPVRVQVCPAAPTPFVMGLLRPVIILPDQPFSRQELRYILLHELTHLRRGDLWVRRASLLALAVHWWNPLVHLLDRKTAELSEESCDERIAARLTHQERCDYGQVLLKVACRTAVPEDLVLPLSTMKSLQRRLSNMLHVKNLTRRQKLLSGCVVLALLVCGTATALAVQSPVAVQDKPASDTLSVQDQEPTQPVTSLPEETEPAVIPEETTEPPAEETDTTPVEDTAVETASPAPSSGTTQTAPNHPAKNSDPASSSASEPQADDTSEPEVIFTVYDADGKLQYTLYEDGTRVNSPEYQLELEASLEAATQKGWLENGQYRRNSHGETYGPNAGIYVQLIGPPDLIAAMGTHGESGYIRDSDADAVPRDLPEEECPHEFLIPLYDCEGNVIGEFATGCGGHISVVGKTIEEVRRELAGENAEVFVSEKTTISTP